MGKVWNFTRATPLLHRVHAKLPTSHIATVQQALNTPSACQAPHTQTYSQHIRPGACQAPQYPTATH